MPMGIIPAIMHTAFDYMVLNALTSRMTIILKIMFNFTYFRFVFNTVIQLDPVPKYRCSYTSCNGLRGLFTCVVDMTIEVKPVVDHHP